MVRYIMKVSDMMMTKVKTVEPNDTIKKTVKIMSAGKIGGIIVVSKGKIVGIFTERDVLRKVVAKGLDVNKTKIKSVMTKRVFTVEKDADIIEAINLMVEKNIKKLPVVHEGKMVGIITATDILRTGERVEYESIKKLSQFYPMDFKTNIGS